MKQNTAKMSNIAGSLIVIILLFFLTIFLIIFPYIKKSFVEKETDSIKLLVEQQIQTLDSLSNSVSEGRMTLSEAKETALDLIIDQRYGANKEFYFWILDMEPVLLMHPFRVDLVGRYVGDFSDKEGNFLFSEMVEIVRTGGEGYLNYLWELPYSQDTVIEKKSFVKLFEPWGWIIGTGFYIEQLSSEIHSLFLLITILSVIVMLLIIMISIRIFRQRIHLNRENVFFQTNYIESERRYKELIASMNEGFVIINAENEIELANRKFAEMTGKKSTEIIGEDMRKFISLDNLNIYTENIKLRKQGFNKAYEIDLLGRNGRRIPTIISPMGVFKNETEYRGSFAVLTDISTLKNTQEALNTSLREKESLIQEIHHRVKNNLQIIISMLNLQKMDQTSKEINSFIERYESRIFSMALVHELLYESSSIDSVDFSNYLNHLVNNMLSEYMRDFKNVKLTEKIDNISIPVDKATVVGLIMTEIIIKFCRLFNEQPAAPQHDLQLESENSSDFYKLVVSSDICLISEEEMEEGKDIDLMFLEILIHQLDGSLEIKKVNNETGLSFILKIPALNTISN